MRIWKIASLLSIIIIINTSVSINQIHSEDNNGIEFREVFGNEIKNGVFKEAEEITIIYNNNEKYDYFLNIESDYYGNQTFKMQNDYTGNYYSILLKDKLSFKVIANNSQEVIVEQFPNSDYKFHIVWPENDQPPELIKIEGVKYIRDAIYLYENQSVTIYYKQRSISKNNISLYYGFHNNLINDFSFDEMKFYNFDGSFYYFYYNLTIENREAWYYVNSEIGFERDSVNLNLRRLYRIYNGFNLNWLGLMDENGDNDVNENEYPIIKVGMQNYTGVEEFEISIICLSNNTRIDVINITEIVKNDIKYGNFTLPHLNWEHRYLVKIKAKDTELGQYITGEIETEISVRKYGVVAYFDAVDLVTNINTQNINFVINDVASIGIKSISLNSKLLGKEVRTASVDLDNGYNPLVLNVTDARDECTIVTERILFDPFDPILKVFRYENEILFISAEDNSSGIVSIELGINGVYKKVFSGLNATIDLDVPLLINNYEKISIEVIIKDDAGNILNFKDEVQEKDQIGPISDTIINYQIMIFTLVLVNIYYVKRRKVNK
ncbi:MAG: hypothetical protein INQ03_08860 [Candidatus Heimdallarchaeota archaeon]|nr:hypothetical protein [Candidatus Heimdallarchaeota archaeon]